MTLKITFKNQYNAFNYQIYMAIAMVGCFYFYPQFRTFIGFAIMTGMWLFSALPALYLHIEYYLRNKGEEITINFDELIVKKNGTVKKYQNSDFEKITVYIAPAYNSGVLGFIYYFYTRLITTKGEEIIITCLMTRKMEEMLKILGAPYQISRKPFFYSLRFGRLKK
ncbi:MAG TPA: hypothetical protein VNG53_07565 [Bacteroidia bacterium]|nr:hypothetical protein [Bacteroidia bacterium]